MDDDSIILGLSVTALMVFSFIGLYLLHKADAKAETKRVAEKRALKQHKKAIRQKEEEDAEKAKRIAEQKEEEDAEKAKRIAEQKLAQLNKYDKALTFSTYELAEIVIGVVALSNFDKLKEVASVLSDQMHVDEVIVEASKKLSSGYESAIKEITGTRCMDIDYSEKEVVAKLESLVDSCIAIGTGAIGKKIGLSASSTGNSSSKGEIRKTKKWKD